MAKQSEIRSVILASSSPRREQLVRSLGLEPRIWPSDADEGYEPGTPPSQLVCDLAERKATAIYNKLQADDQRGVIIGADTVVVLDGEVLGKPENPAHALKMLTKLQGNEHEVYSGVSLIDSQTGNKLTKFRMTLVHMKPCSREQLERYIATGEPMDKAGAYGIQGLGGTLVESIDGCYFNVVGLPISLLSDMLSQFGIEVV